MIKAKFFILPCMAILAFSFSCATNSAYADALATKIYSESPADPLLVAFDTELFNLLTNRTSLIDNKNHFNKKFSRSFDLLLLRSTLAKTHGNEISLRQRLMSGPAPKPRFLTNLSSGKRYVYFEACQAHMCDVNRLAVLYEPATNAMYMRLLFETKEEYLGELTPSEMQIWDAINSKR